MKTNSEIAKNIIERRDSLLTRRKSRVRNVSRALAAAAAVSASTLALFVGLYQPKEETITPPEIVNTSEQVQIDSETTEEHGESTFHITLEAEYSFIAVESNEPNFPIKDKLNPVVPARRAKSLLEHYIHDNGTPISYVTSYTQDGKCVVELDTLSLEIVEQYNNIFGAFNKYVDYKLYKGDN